MKFHHCKLNIKLPGMETRVEYHQDHAYDPHSNADMLAMPPDSITLGIVLGLFAGKQIGVMLFAWLAIRSGRASLPENVGWPMIYGASCLAGVGFTMSLFISELAFAGALRTDEAKLGILAGSLLAGLWGYLVLRRALRRVRV